MPEYLIWTYLANATLLICHEIDSAYWREWELFRLPGKAGGFVLLHLPLVGLVLWGLWLLIRGTRAGLVFLLALAACGLLAFGLHLFFLLRGRAEFRAPVSLGLLIAILLASLLQGVWTLRAWLAMVQ